MQGIIKIDQDHPLYSILMEALQDQSLDNDSTSQPDDLDFLNRLLVDAGMLDMEDEHIKSPGPSMSVDMAKELAEDFLPDEPDNVGMSINDKDYYVHPDVAELFTDMSSTISSLRKELEDPQPLTQSSLDQRKTALAFLLGPECADLSVTIQRRPI